MFIDWGATVTALGEVCPRPSLHKRTNNFHVGEDFVCSDGLLVVELERFTETPELLERIGLRKVLRS